MNIEQVSQRLEKIRSDFERWHAREYTTMIKRKGDVYTDDFINARWAAWLGSYFNFVVDKEN